MSNNSLVARPNPSIANSGAPLSSTLSAGIRSTQDLDGVFLPTVGDDAKIVETNGLLRG